MSFSSDPPADDLPGAGGIIGREAETAAIRRMISKSRLVTVTGLPGVGKSAAAIAAARTVRGRYRDGVYLIPLDTLQDEALLPHTIAAALLLPDTFSGSPLAELTAYLADKQLLLLLDTCEHMIGSVALVAAAISEACPGVHVLATSREPLRVPGEQMLTVGPLAEDDGVELLSAKTGGAAKASERVSRRLIARKLDGLPLALGMAAREIGARDADTVLARLNDEGFDFLTDPDAAAARHRSLYGAIGWSHQLCTPAERLLWARAAVFDDAFCVAACQEVCANTHLSPSDVEIGISLLAERSLLIDQAGAPQLFTMPSTIRAYGLDMLRRLAEEDEMRRRYRRWRAGPRQDACWQLLATTNST